MELHTDPDLREINMGRWEDRTWGEVRQTEGERLLQFNHSDPAWVAPGGESLGDVGARAERAIRRIAGKYPGQTVAVFSHGTAIRQFLANVKGIPPESGTPCHTRTHLRDLSGLGRRRCSMWYLRGTLHLDDSISTLAQQTWWRKGAQKKEDVNLWYRPLDPASERDFYLDARRDAWISTYGGGPAL